MQGVDGCHFNDEDYEVLGKAVAKCIRQKLAQMKDIG
jgi:lysophospholipase L1-like esterase